LFVLLLVSFRADETIALFGSAPMEATKSLLRLSPLTALQTLSLQYYPFEDDGLKALQTMTQLKRLDLRGSHIRGDGLAYLVSGADNDAGDCEGICGSLEKLDLSFGLYFEDKGMLNLAQITSLKRLE